MHALRRPAVAFFFVAAAIFSAGASAHATAAPAAHHTAQLASSVCPAGTNWDDILQACV